MFDFEETNLSSLLCPSANNRLVLWLEDDQVGVMPESAMKAGQILSVGSFVECKWGKKFYEARILKLSGE